MKSRLPKIPTQLLDSLIASSTDPDLQARLARVNEELKRNVSLIARQREEAAGNLIQSAALVAETVNNYNIRLTNLKKDRDQARAARDEATAKLYETAIANGRSALEGALAIYIDNLANGTRYTDAVIQAQFQRTREELNHKPVLGKKPGRPGHAFRQARGPVSPAAPSRSGDDPEGTAWTLSRVSERSSVAAKTS